MQSAAIDGMGGLGAFGSPTPVAGFDGRPALAARFTAERHLLLVARLRVTCWLAIALVPLFGALDAIIHPQVLGPLLAIRLAMVVATASVLAALATAVGRERAGMLSMVMVCGTGFGVVLMTSLTGGTSEYYAGINLVLLAAAVLLPWSVRWLLAAGAVLIVAYAVSAVRTGLDRPGIFAAHLFFLGSTVAIGAVSQAARERSSRREFLQRAALEEAGRHRDEFVANITHELRTPLAAILGFAELLDDHAHRLGEEPRAWLGRIHANASTLYRLIVQVLDFSRVEAGALRVQCETVDATPIVFKVADDMRAIAGPGGVKVATDIAAEVPPVRGDAARIEEIVTNLAANALKFSAGRPIRLTLRRGSPDNGWHRVVPPPARDLAGIEFAEIGVTDGGEGISHDDLSRLFVAFQQLDGSSTRRRGGTGLGLAISARLAAAMNGHVAVRSTPGAGSTFALLLPVADA